MKVIIDTDPGIDDAVAILFALAAGWEVLGLTTVAGNIPVDTTTRNAGRILALAARADVAVIAGAPAPLARAGRSEAAIHGTDGLGGVAFPDPVAPAREGAVDWLADTLLREAAGSVDLLVLGPMTNIALLLRAHPVALRRARRIIAMGGAIHEPGNVGPRAEFNIAADPEAAAEVLSAGLPVTLVPLDVTRRVRATRPWCDTLRASGRVGAVASADLIAAYFDATAHQSDVAESRPLHDPCVMLLADAPNLFVTTPMVLSVDCGAGRDAGALNAGDEGPTVQVAMGVDAPAALALLAARLSA